MDPAKRRTIALKCALLAVIVVIAFRFIQHKVVGRFAPLAFWDIPVAASVAFALVTRMLDPRTWSYSEMSDRARWLYSFSVAWIGYGSITGLSLAPSFGLTLGMAYGFLGTFALISALTAVFTAVRIIQDDPC